MFLLFFNTLAFVKGKPSVKKDVFPLDKQGHPGLAADGRIPVQNLLTPGIPPSCQGPMPQCTDAA
jgi:hypothetical protein